MQEVEQRDNGGTKSPTEMGREGVALTDMLIVQMADLLRYSAAKMEEAIALIEAGEDGAAIDLLRSQTAALANARWVRRYQRN